MKFLLIVIIRNLEYIWLEIITLLRHKINFYLIKLNKESPNKIHFGCGDIKLAGFTNIDIQRTLAADRNLDLRRTLPYKKNSVDLIFSEHVFEHFENWELERIFKESFRILKKGGVLIFSVPNYEKLIQGLLAGKESKLIDSYTKDLSRFGLYFKQNNIKLKHSFLLNWLVYQGGDHKLIYTYELLNYFLTKSGFKNIKKRDFIGGLDSENRKQISLFIEAKK